MNLLNHVNVYYHDEDKVMGDVRSPLYVRHEPVVNKPSARIYEVIKQKRVITDKVPVASAFFILSHAKLHVHKVSIVCILPYNYEYPSLSPKSGIL